MEVQTVNSLHNPPALISSLQITSSASPSGTPKKKTAANADAVSGKQSSTEAAILEQLSKQQQKQQEPENHSRDCDSPASSNSELEKELNDLHDLNGSLTGSGSISKSNGSLSGGSSTNSAPPGSAITSLPLLNGSPQTSGVAGTAQFKKRISSSRAPTRKAHRIKFYRNGDRFYPGITIPVSNERYRSFESLYEDLTRLLEENVKIPGAVRAIYTMCGRKVSKFCQVHSLHTIHYFNLQRFAVALTNFFLVIV